MSSFNTCTFTVNIDSDLSYATIWEANIVLFTPRIVKTNLMKTVLSSHACQNPHGMSKVIGYYSYFHLDLLSMDNVWKETPWNNNNLIKKKSVCVIGWTFCLSHPKLANPMSSVSVEQFGKSARHPFSLRVTLDTHHNPVVRRYVQRGLTKLLPKPVSRSEKPSVLFFVLLLSRRHFPALIKLTLLQYSSRSSGKWLGKQTNELFLFWGTKFPLSCFFHSHCVSRGLWESVISLTGLMLFFRSCHVGDFHQYLIEIFPDKWIRYLITGKGFEWPKRRPCRKTRHCLEVQRKLDSVRIISHCCWQNSQYWSWLQNAAEKMNHNKTHLNPIIQIVMLTCGLQCKSFLNINFHHNWEIIQAIILSNKKTSSFNQWNSLKH